MPKPKPVYEFIRYDIRPPSGLTDVESDYITKCVNSLESHSNVAEVLCAFELPSSQRCKRSTGKHCHLGIRFKKGVRTDKVPIFKVGRVSLTKHSVKVCTAELFTVGEYWKMGYIQKDGQHFGKSKDYHPWWLEHQRCIKSKVVRQPDMTCGSILNDVINWWYQEHKFIRKKHIELLGVKNALGCVEVPTLTIAHVYANYIIVVHPNVRLSNRIARRLWLAQTTWSDYETLVAMATDTKTLEVDTPGRVYSTGFEEVPRKYNAMEKIYPIEDGEY